jgi:hypothetical protein
VSGGCESADRQSIAQISEALGALPNTGANVLVFPDVDRDINVAVGSHQDAQTDWKYGPVDLSAQVRKLRVWSLELWGRFLPREFGGKVVRCPKIFFRFECECPRVLGHYVPGRNDTGLRWEISINPVHLGTRSERAVAAVLLHELLHLFEDAVGIAPRSPNGYHSSWFRRSARNLGIPCTRYGAELGIVTPSRFTAWADERGLQDGAVLDIPEPEAAAPDPIVALGKRVAWVCSCPVGVRVTVQVPRGSALLARCERCGELFERKPHGSS